MKTTEIELKLALPDSDPAQVATALARLPALAGVPQHTHWLWNRYYDTPQHTLRQQRCALRLRGVAQEPFVPDQPPVGASWWQTFKTAGVSHQGLSQRGEWECAVAGPALDATALALTPWADLDPQGELWPQLQACFETECQRSVWQVCRPDGSHIELAWDVGQAKAQGLTEAFQELELELCAGTPETLWSLARAIQALLPAQPSDTSKAQRGYALAERAQGRSRG